MTPDEREERIEERNNRYEKQAIKDALSGAYTKYVDVGITSEYFERFRKEWKYIEEANARYNGVPSMETFMERFPAIQLPEETDPTGMIIEYLDRKHKYDVLVPEVNKLVRAMQDGRVNSGIEDFVRIASQTSGRSVGQSENVFAVAQRRFDLYERRRQSPTPKITTGFAEIDSITGGMGESDLIIIAGEPGQGKSTLGIKSAYEASQTGKRVAYFNGEMDNDEIGYKIDSFITHLSAFSMLNGKWGIAEKYREAIQKIKEKKNELYILSRADVADKITPRFLERYCIKNKIEVLYLDQFSLLDGNSRYRTEQEVSYELVRDLKTMQKKLQIPVVLLAQIKRQDKQAKRQTKEGDPIYELSDLGKTRALEEFASVVLMLNQRYEKDERGWIPMDVWIGKNRNGQRGNLLTYVWNFDKGQVEFLKSTQPLPTTDEEKMVQPKIEDVADDIDMVDVQDELPWGDEEDEYVDDAQDGDLPY